MLRPMRLSGAPRRTVLCAHRELPSVLMVVAGGMGAYAPAPIMDNALRARIHQTVLQPAIDGMRQMKMPYVGVLYAGLMISP